MAVNSSKSVAPVANRANYVATASAPLSQDEYMLRQLQQARGLRVATSIAPAALPLSPQQSVQNILERGEHAVADLEQKRKGILAQMTGLRDDFLAQEGRTEQDKSRLMGQVKEKRAELEKVKEDLNPMITRVETIKSEAALLEETLLQYDTNCRIRALRAASKKTAVPSHNADLENLHTFFRDLEVGSKKSEP